MTALLTARPGFRVAAARQESLFGDPDELERPAAAAPAAPPAPAPPEHEPPEHEPLAPPARTLDAAIGSLWERITTGQTATCPVCDAPMEPRPSASGVVGGRCRSCGSTLG